MDEVKWNRAGTGLSVAPSSDDMEKQQQWCRQQKRGVVGCGRLRSPGDEFDSFHFHETDVCRFSDLLQGGAGAAKTISERYRKPRSRSLVHGTSGVRCSSGQIFSGNTMERKDGRTDRRADAQTDGLSLRSIRGEPVRCRSERPSAACGGELVPPVAAIGLTRDHGRVHGAEDV
ncbi:unnamed protein product [Heligmosomoides polygyrus]|uniref:Uncharacterized protein n=1 Tax=Heligmosomoides polygyrus TaxID=6339 RepID=A0A183FMH2_HELPZ|nr:unnamed protein product [Heligmosomoides polygyrus]